MIALQAMRGVKLVTAATIVSGHGPVRTQQWWARSPRQHYQDGKLLRRVIVETSWHYRHPPRVAGDLRKWQREAPAQACTIGWNAQQRLNKRYRHLLARGKTSHQTVVAIGRQLLGFIWAIASTVNATSDQPAAA
jgi:hypothetical protein